MTGPLRGELVSVHLYTTGEEGSIRSGPVLLRRRALSADKPLPNRLLDCGPRKCHIEHVLAALIRAQILCVNVYAYILKSSGAYFLFLDDINRDASVELDIGFHLRPNAGCITLVKPRAGANIPHECE